MNSIYDIQLELTPQTNLYLNSLFMDTININVIGNQNYCMKSNQNNDNYFINQLNN